MAVVRRDGMPLSLVNAFTAPVRPGERSLAFHAAEALAHEWTAMSAMYDGLLPDAPPAEAYVATPHADALNGLSSARRNSVREVSDAVDEAVAGAAV